MNTDTYLGCMDFRYIRMSSKQFTDTFTTASTCCLAAYLHSMCLCRWLADASGTGKSAVCISYATALG